jgi:hypothetical protein
VTNIESVLTAGGTARIVTPGALTLEGAQLSGQRVEVQAGSLAITSQQDTSTFKSKQTNIGVAVSADFNNKDKSATNKSGFAGAGASVSFGQTKQSGDFASVQEQSGIKAGSGGFDIRVAGATTLTGGVIASEAEAANNQLTTGTLSATDLQNREKFKASSINLSASISGIGRPSAPAQAGAPANGGNGTNTGTGTGNTAQVPANGQGEPTVGGNRTGTTAGLRTGIGTIAAGLPSVASASGSQSSTTLSAIATGGITITSGDTASLGVAQTISRDTSAANEALTKEFTAAKREDIAQGFAAAQALTQQVSVFFNNRASEEADLRKNAEALAKKDANGTALRDPLTGAYIPADGLSAAQSRALVTLNTSIEGYRTFGAGGATRIALTALSGAAGSNVAGGLGSLAQSAAVNVLQSLAVTRVKELADSIQGDPATRESVRAALQAVVGCAGAAAGGSNGCGSAAAGAAASVVLNNLLSTGTTTGTDADGNPLTLEAQQARTNLVATIIAGIAGAVGADVSAAVTGAIIETENNSVSIGCTASETVTCLNDQQIISRNTDFAAVGAVNLAALQTCLNGPLGTRCDEGRDVVVDRIAGSDTALRAELNGLSNVDLLARYETHVETKVNDALLAILNPGGPRVNGGLQVNIAGDPTGYADPVFDRTPTPAQIAAARAAVVAGVNPADLREFINYNGGINVLVTRTTPITARQIASFTEIKVRLERDGPAALGSVNLERFNAFRQNPDAYPFATARERDEFRLALSYEQYLRKTNPSLSETAFQNLVFRNVPVDARGGAAGVGDSLSAIFRMMAAGEVMNSLAQSCAAGIAASCDAVTDPNALSNSTLAFRDLCNTLSCLSSARTASAVTDVGLLLLPVAGEVNGLIRAPAGLSAVARADLAALNAEARATSISGTGTATLDLRAPLVADNVTVSFGSNADIIASGVSCVYNCVINGVTRYVGITDDVLRRGAEHLRVRNIQIEEIQGLSNLSRADARAVEQTLINFHGLGSQGGTLLNQINSISRVTNKTKYEAALVRGAEILRSIRYPGF